MLQQIDTITNPLLQYGVLGIFSVALIAALSFVFNKWSKNQESTITDLKTQISQERDARIKLEGEFHSYISNESKQILSALVKSTDALEGNTQVLALIKAKL